MDSVHPPGAHSLGKRVGSGARKEIHTQERRGERKSHRDNGSKGRQEREAEWEKRERDRGSQRKRQEQSLRLKEQLFTVEERGSRNGPRLRGVSCACPAGMGLCSLLSGDWLPGVSFTSLPGPIQEATPQGSWLREMNEIPSGVPGEPSWSRALNVLVLAGSQAPEGGGGAGLLQASPGSCWASCPKREALIPSHVLRSPPSLPQHIAWLSREGVEMPCPGWKSGEFVSLESKQGREVSPFTRSLFYIFTELGLRVFVGTQ
jgi:hypothetical protein